MSEQQVPESDPEAGAEEQRPSGLRRAVSWTLKLLLVMFLGAVIGVGAYLTLPSLYRGFYDPVRSNAHRIDLLSTEIVAARRESDRTLGTLASGQAGLEATLAAESRSSSGMGGDLQQLQATQSAFGSALGGLSSVPEQLATMRAQTTALAGEVQALGTAMATPTASGQDLTVTTQILRSMQLITQAQLALQGGNAGEADADLSRARDGLSALIANGPQSLADPLTQVVKRLDLARQELKNNPAVAGADISIAWRLLADLSAGP